MCYIGHYKAILCRHISNAVHTASYVMIHSDMVLFSVVVLSGLDFKAAGGSIVCYRLSNYLLPGCRVADIMHDMGAFCG